MKRVIILLFILLYTTEIPLVAGLCGSKGSAFHAETHFEEVEITSGDLKPILREIASGKNDKEKEAILFAMAFEVLQEGHLEACCLMLKEYVRFGNSYALKKRLLEDLLEPLYEGVREKSGRNLSRKGVTLILEDVVACVPPLKLSEITEVIADYEADFPYDESSHTSTVCPEGIETTERGLKPQVIGELKAFALRNLKGLITAGNDLCAISAGREFGKIPPNSERQDAVVLGAILCLTNPEGFDVLIKLLPREEAKVRVAKNIVSVEGYPDIAPEIITRAKEYIVKHSPPLSYTRTVAPPT